jgi:hypothetical protein
MQYDVNSLLSIYDQDTPLDGMLLNANTLCVIRYITQATPHRIIEEEAEEEQTQTGA